MGKILHLFRVEKFTNAYINFINNNFINDCHEFWIYGRRNLLSPLPKYKNIKFVNSIGSKLKSGEIYQFEKIIYHGLFEQEIIDFFARNRKLFSKLYLYFWGGDKFYVDNRWQNLKKQYVVRNAHGIITILPEEQRYMRKYYRPKGKCFCAMYYQEAVIEKLQKLSDNKVEKDYTEILLGNSATATNNHLAVLQKLSQYKGENIKIYAPLSYGDKNYASVVIEHGEKIFGEKFIGITDFMKEDDYYDFLSHMDIGIFDMKRQQALGNIMAMLALGKKIYLRKHSVNAHFFSIVNHSNIWTTDEIENMSFADFISFDQNNAEDNKIVMKHMFEKETNIEAWKKIFDEE